ncbi:unnamed protein product [Ectocarpus sp. CCAP 1310/34]|nr:unnamed protein product [Ectocarpus sp. CCAP 1310/34]
MGMHGMTTCGNMKRQICLKNKISFTSSPSATYSASVVESVTHFCVLENQDTAPPPHVTIPPDTDLRSAALLAKSASAYPCKLNPSTVVYLSETKYQSDSSSPTPIIGARRPLPLPPPPPALPLPCVSRLALPLP